MPCSHKGKSKQRWALAQKVEMESISRQKCQQQLAKTREQANARYMPHIKSWSNAMADDGHILDLACGAICLANEIESGRKVFLDPLLDFLRRELPGALPDLPDEQVLATEAERMSFEDQSFDMVLFLRGVNHVHNPELVLHEVERVLKADGVLLISAVVWPVFLSRMFYWLSPWISLSMVNKQLYCYARRGIYKTLDRHFEIVSETRLPVMPWYSPSREYFYVCKQKVENP